MRLGSSLSCLSGVRGMVVSGLVYGLVAACSLRIRLTIRILVAVGWIADAAEVIAEA